MDRDHIQKETLLKIDEMLSSLADEYWHQAKFQICYVIPILMMILFPVFLFAAWLQSEPVDKTIIGWATMGIASVAFIMFFIFSVTVRQRRNVRKARANRIRYFSDKPPPFCLYLRNEKGCDEIPYAALPGGGVMDRPYRPSTVLLKRLFAEYGVDLIGLCIFQKLIDTPDFKPILALDEYWKNDAIYLMENAEVIVLDVQYMGEGLSWECSQIRKLFAKKTLLVVNCEDQSKLEETLPLNSQWRVDSLKRGPRERCDFELPLPLRQLMEAQRTRCG